MAKVKAVEDSEDAAMRHGGKNRLSGGLTKTKSGKRNREAGSEVFPGGKGNDRGSVAGTGSLDKTALSVSTSG